MIIEDRAARLRRIIDENAAVDLHAHSRHSDGAWSPEQLAADGLKEGLAMLALTDHDVVSGVTAFELAAYRRGLLPVTGCEVTAVLEGRSYHILSYDIDPSAEVWAKIVENRAEARHRYFHRLFELLREKGFNVTVEMAQDERAEYVASPTSTALIKGGKCQTGEQARELLRNAQIE